MTSLALDDINKQCDGCMSGMTIINGIHVDRKDNLVMCCTNGYFATCDICGGGINRSEGVREFGILYCETCHKEYILGEI
jgi:hypothetical protein